MHGDRLAKRHAGAEVASTRPQELNAPAAVGVGDERLDRLGWAQLLYLQVDIVLLEQVHRGQRCPDGRNVR
jgi:hypothetical protein